MVNLIYTPDEDVKVHEEGAIRVICKAFQSHETGLPEWLKNAADAYARENASESKRVIILIFDSGRREARPSISCLDFSGMTSAMIEENFRIWADPEAARRGTQYSMAIQGGHGNGGKCYMTHMFEDYALLHTAKKGKRNRYGVVGGSVRFGYIPNRQEGRDCPIRDLQSELEGALKSVRCSLDILPDAVAEAFKQADGFTLVTGVGPKGYGNKTPAYHLITDLQEHPQMIRTLEFCKVYAVVNGELFDEGKPISLPEIPPMEGAEKPRVIPIPAALMDPRSNTPISMTNEGSFPAGSLVLRTSSVSMRWSRKGRHLIIYRGQSGYIGYVPVPALDVQSPYRDRIYGECRLEALEPYKQNERARLANSPLTRAVEDFISQQVQAYAREFEAQDRRRYDQAAKNAVTKMNEALDRWKNRFLKELIQGLWGPGVEGPPPPPPPLPGGKPARLEMSLTHKRAGLGVSFRPALKFLDQTGHRIRPVPVRWFSEDTNVAMVDEDLMAINTFAYGSTSIYAETVEGRLRSNSIPLEVVRIEEIGIVPREIQLAVGSRKKLEAMCRLATGEETSDVYLVWTESSPAVARVSSAGLVFGFSIGETEVVAGDDNCLAAQAARIKVVVGEGRGPGRDPGRGFPLVLVSGDGFDRDPTTEEYVNFSPGDPPVAQRPQDSDRNIWWINSASPLAKLYLDTSKGYGYDSREWRMYHVERYIDVIVQIVLTHSPMEQDSVPLSDWILKWGFTAAEIQSATASDLHAFIGMGQPPTD